MRPTKPKAKARQCAVCKEPLPAIRRQDRLYCSQQCKLIAWALRKQDDRRQGERRVEVRPGSGRRVKDAA